jgi:hypothetical protein
VSAIPGRPPGSVTSVDAVICVSGQELCRRIVPPDWKYRQLDAFVTTAFPPP